MSDDGAGPDHGAGPRAAAIASRPDASWTAHVVQEVIAAIPGGYTWLLPITDAGGAVVDFRIAATSDEAHDLYRLGRRRLQARLSDLYPSMVDGPLWRMYHRVLSTGQPDEMGDFQYEEKSAGVVARSRFLVSATPV